jgi:hypothetical protein
MYDCFFLNIEAEKKNSNLILDAILCLINLVFGITAICSNALVLRAISRTPSLKCPSNTLLLCLAVSDLLVGLLVQLSYIPYRIFLHLEASELTCVAGVVFEITGWFLSAVTFFTLFAISFERYVAISFPLRYNQVITGKRVLKIFAGIVFFSGALASCRLYVINNRIVRTINAALIPGNFSTLCLVYFKIFLVVKKKRFESHKLRTRFGCNACAVEVHLATELRRFTKSTLTMVYIGGVFFICYIPFFCTMIGYLVHGETKSISMFYYITLTILFISSSLNPFLYCFRIRPIRSAMKKTFAEIVSYLKAPHVEDRNY